MGSSIRKRRGLAITAGIATIALTLTACGGGDGDNNAGDDSTGGSDEQVTLSVTVFGDGGYEGKGDAKRTDLFREYEKQNPNVKIKESNLGQGGDGLTAALNAIGAGGAGLADVMMVEEGWLGQMTPIAADTFVDLRDFGADELKGRWVDWKAAQGTTPDGQVWAYGTDIGPQGLCFDQTQMEKAGIATDRDSFAAALGGKDATWDKFWEVGAKYTAATGKPWIGVPSFAWNSFVNQQDEGYYKKDGTTLNIEGNNTLKDFLSTIVDQHKAGVAGSISAWSWTNEDFHGNFGVHICPGWMLGAVSEAVSSGADTWDFADVFPGGATNWGGSFFAVPKVSKHQEAAAKLADWLTAPEQQIVAFQNAGAFPSQVEAQTDPAVVDATNETFNNAPIGKILSARAEGVVAQVKGEKDSVIQDQVFGDVINRINSGEITTGDQAWQAALDTLAAQGIS